MSNVPYLGGSFFTKGAIAERRVCRIEIRTPTRSGGGTGFLVGPDLVMTNRHVIQPPGQFAPFRASSIRVRFKEPEGEGPSEATAVERVVGLVADYVVAQRPFSARDAGDRGGPPDSCELDYAILRLSERIGVEGNRGWYDLRELGVPPRDSWLTIIQHPELGPRASAFDDRGVLGANDNATRLRHRVDTAEGSSGSPCFDRSWNVVALHQAGHPGSDLEGTERFNQAVPIHCIVRDLSARDLLPLTKIGNREPEIINPLRPTLILLGAEGAGEARAERLLSTLDLPSEVLVRRGGCSASGVGNQSVVVVLRDGMGLSETDKDALIDLGSIGVEVIPILESEEGVSHEAWESLGWPSTQEAPPALLGAKIRQGLGIEGDRTRRHSIVLCSDPDDSQIEAEALAEALAGEGFEVFRSQGGGMGQIEGLDSHASDALGLLLLETPDAWKSEVVRDELLWAQARGLAIAIVQRGKIERRPAQVGSLPAKILDPDTPLVAALGPIAEWVDQRIRRTNRRRAGLATSAQSILQQHPKTRRATLSWVTADISIVTFDVEILGGPVPKRLLLRWSPCSPTPALVQNLVEFHRRSQVAASLLLYESPEKEVTLSALDQKILNALVGDLSISYAERHEMTSAIHGLVQAMAEGKDWP